MVGVSLQFGASPVPCRGSLFTMFDDKVYAVSDGSLAVLQPRGGGWLVAQHDLPAGITDVKRIHVDDDLVVLSGREGLAFFANDEPLTPLCLDDVFHSAFGWNDLRNTIEFGRLFEDPGLLGICTKHVKKGVEFFGVDKTSVADTDSPVMELELTTMDSILRESSDVYLTPLSGGPLTNVLVRHAEGLAVYLFNDELGLDRVLDIPDLRTPSDRDFLFFPRFTPGNFQDVVLCNSSGLFAYRYSPALSNYEFFMYNPFFSRASGWEREHYESLRFPDVDGDGRSEVVFSGPQGLDILTLNPLTGQLDSLLDQSSVQPHHRYATIIGASPRGISLLVNDSLHHARFSRTTETEPEETPKVPEVQNTTGVFPPKGNFTVKRKVLLKNQLDHSALMNAVDISTGKISLTLTLVQVPNSLLQLLLIYDGSDKSDFGVVATGWTMPQSYIFINHQNSVFPEDHSYYVSLEGVTLPLTASSKGSTEKMKVFAVTGVDYLKIEYAVGSETWTVENEKSNVRYRFGGRNIRWDLKWKTWMSVGRMESGNKKQVAIEWHLTETHHERTGSVRNLYTSVPAEDRRITKEIYLDSSEDDQGNRLQFRYAAKPVVDNQRITDDEGNLTPSFVNNKYLVGYTLTTKGYEQSIDFGYKFERGGRLMTSLVQGGEDVLRFEYAQLGDEVVMTKAELENGPEVSFDYKRLGRKSRLEDEIGYRRTFLSTYKVDEADVLLVSQLTTDGQVELKAVDRYQLQELDLRFPLIGIPNAKSYSTVMTETFFVVYLEYALTFQLCIIGRSADRWSTVPHYFEYETSEYTIQIGSNFVAVGHKNGSIEVIEWDEEAAKPKRTSLNLPQGEKQWIVSQKRLVTYDNKELHVCYKADQWLCQSLKEEPNIYNGISDLLKKFKLDSASHERHLKYFKMGMLQMSGNLVTLSYLRLSSATQLDTFVRFYLLNSSYEIGQELTKSIPQDNLTETICEKCVLEPTEGNKYFFGYTMNAHGEFLPTLKKTEITNKGEEYDEESVNESMRKNITELFLELPKYKVSVTQTGVEVSDVRVVYTGSDLEEVKKKENDADIKLGSKFVVVKEGNYHVYNLEEGKKTGVHCFNLQTNNLTQIQFRFPEYLASQGEGGDVNVVRFSADGRMSAESLPGSETISPWTGWRHLVTETGAPGLKYFIVRPLTGGTAPNAVVTCQVTRLGDLERKVGYEYVKPSGKSDGGVVRYDITRQIPGNDKKSHGWIEHISGVQTVFDGQGNVKRVPTDEGGVEEEETMPDLKNVLYDASGKWPIAVFSPGEVLEQDVSYYGFEAYEVNRIGRINQTESARWEFNVNGVRDRAFSFTGQRGLELQGEEQALRGVFRVSHWSHYVAATWVMVGRPLEIGATTPLLMVTVSNGVQNNVDLLGKVKLTRGPWMYIEVVLDVKHTCAMLENDAASAGNATATVVLRPVGYQTLHVDHIRVHPFRSRFQGKVYNHAHQETEVILENGLVKRYVYDEYGRQIAATSELGSVDVLRSYSKGNGRKSEVEVLPVEGFHERFDEDAFGKNWSLDAAAHWEVAPSPRALRHNSHSPDELRSMYATGSSHGVRFQYDLRSPTSSIALPNISIARVQDMTELRPQGRTVPSAGDVVFIRDQRRVLLWIDGALLVDELNEPKTELVLQITGDVVLSDVILFKEPRVKVTYFNELKEKTQELQYENETGALVREFLYDDVGRGGTETKWVRVETNGPLLGYRPMFVTNKNPQDHNSVFNTGVLRGDINVLDPGSDGYGFKTTRYDDSPLDEVVEQGLPGKDFSISGKFSSKFSTAHNVTFLELYYPRSQNFTHFTEFKPGDVVVTTVYDSRENKVAVHKQIPNRVSLLSTYEYNESGKLVKSLAPLYHEKALTNFKIIGQERSEEEEKLELAMGTHMLYDKQGHMVSKVTPDCGKTEYVYSNGTLRYLMYFGKDTSVRDVLAFEYDRWNRLAYTGLLLEPRALEQLQSFNETYEMSIQQRFIYNDLEVEPLLRGRTQRVETFNDGKPFAEESVLDANGNVLKKSVVLPLGDEETLRVVINQRYEGGLLRELEYPSEVQGKPLVLRYEYNRLGQLVELGLRGSERPLLQYGYNPSGQVSTEGFLPDTKHGFLREYRYNVPGFLTSIEDEYLREQIFYTEAGYGTHGYGDGTVTRTKFDAKWHKTARANKIRLQADSFVSEEVSLEDSKVCFEALRKNGYIDESGHQATVLYPKLALALPLRCSLGVPSRQIQATLGRQGFPASYGHVYDYGNHQELTKAKYFVGDSIPEPLQPDTFSKLSGNINATLSASIWNKLSELGYVIESQGKSTDLPQGQMRKSFVRQTLLGDLKAADENYAGFSNALAGLLTFYVSANKTLTQETLAQHLADWGRRGDVPGLWKVLEDKGYVDDPLADDLKTALGPHLKEVVSALYDHFGRSLGEGEFDLGSYDIDVNGNHRKFYTGFDHLELDYAEHTNQVSEVRMRSSTRSKPEVKCQMEHDYRGNVVRAMHKNIERIEYKHALNRPTKVVLIGGRTLQFWYDSKGERVLKRVRAEDGKVQREVHYFRDQNGRCLVERRMNLLAQEQPPLVEVISYVYGPRGLVGFFRRNQFYSVLTDHEGSTRLVLRAGEVVAAYDYMPYGNLMRKYVSYPEADLMYRYTGQEWDEELQLYNYHERFYDPDIGRFYQTDPKGQYFSPYMYAGNSPVSLVDPDGQFAIFLVLIGAFIGGFLGGAAANKNWNPIKWDYSKMSTWKGILMGGVEGALALNGVGSLTLLKTALGLGYAFMNMASANGSFDVRKWNWSSPDTWNAAFSGFTSGASIANGIGKSFASWKTLSSTAKVFFGVAAVGTLSTAFVLGGMSNNWDFTKPGTWNSILDAMTIATTLPSAVGDFVTRNGRVLRSSMRNVNVGLRQLRQSSRQATNFFNRVSFVMSGLRQMDDFGKLVKSSGKLVLAPIGVGGGAYVLSSMAADDWTHWDMTDPDTYLGLIDNLISAMDVTELAGDGVEELSGWSAGRQRRSVDLKTAGKASDVYQAMIRGEAVSLKAAGVSDAVIEQWTRGDGPNTHVTVAMGKELMFVACSEMLFVYERGALYNPILLTFFDVGENTAVPTKIQRAIEGTHAVLEERNFAEQKNALKIMLDSKFDNDELTEASRSKLIEVVEQVMSEKGFIGRNNIENAISKALKEDDSRGEEMSRQADVLRTEIKNGLVETKLQETKEKLNELETKRNEHDNLLKRKGKEAVEDLWEATKPFQDKLATWDPMSCAVRQPSTSRKNLFEYPEARTDYAPKDIRYESSDLNPFSSCSRCVRTPADVKCVRTAKNIWEGGVNVTESPRVKREVVLPHPGTDSAGDEGTSFTDASAEVDVNGSLFLLDVIIRKMTGRKYVGRNGGVSEGDATAAALAITDRFEVAIDSSTEGRGAETIDFSAVQRAVYKLILADAGGKIPEVLTAFACGVVDLDTALFLQHLPHVVGQPGPLLHVPPLPNETCPSLLTRLWNLLG